MLLSFEDAKLVAKAEKEPASLSRREKRKALALDDLNMMTKDEHLFRKEILAVLSVK